ncbi:MAG TPA: cytochrome b [Rhizomicrobium sp.]|jgi:cytochrome b561|nr:cytochrome b [Rhizomicrobium sp.]
MSARSSNIRYGTVAMTFHWVIAALIITNVVLGIYFVNGLDRQDPLRRVIIGWHESIGVTVLILSLLRLGWRLVNPVPKLPADFSPAKRILARGTHYALYTLMILVPFVGWELASIPSRPLVLFGNVPWPKIWYLANLAQPDQRFWAGIIAPSHIILAFLLFALAIGHLSAALFYHYMIRKDQILQRMVPGTNVSAQGTVGTGHA